MDEINDLSFDPADPYFPVAKAGSLRFAVQVFTTGNVYGLDPAATKTKYTDGGLTLRASALRWGGQQFDSAGSVEVELLRDGDVVTIAATAQHDEPVKAIKVLIRGLPKQALSAGWWHPSASLGQRHVAGYLTPVAWSYPNGQGWLTPWAAADSMGPSIAVSVRDPQVRSKRLYAHTPPWADGDTVLEVICDQDATLLSGSFSAPEIRIRLGTSVAAVEQDWREHLDWLESAYGLESWDTRPDVPDWARGVRLVVNLHGQHWTGHVFNTFDDMVEALRFLCEHIPGNQVLAYVPGWEGRYYWQYPVFKPAEVLGGADGLLRLSTAADELGVTLMPMLGAHGANTQMYADWKEAAFRNVTDQYVELVNKPDWDGDRRGEDDQVFLNTGEPRFRKFLLDQAEDIIDRFGARAIYFDTTAAWFNDPRHNLIHGYRELKAQLLEHHPDLLVVGEGWFDALLPIFPMNLSWQGTRQVSYLPELLTRYGRVIQHLVDGAPGAGSTGVYEGGYLPADRAPVLAGHLPSISFVRDTLSEHRKEIIAICNSLALYSSSDGTEAAAGKQIWAG